MTSMWIVFYSPSSYVPFLAKHRWWSWPHWEIHRSGRPAVVATLEILQSWMKLQQQKTELQSHAFGWCKMISYWQIGWIFCIPKKALKCVGRWTGFQLHGSTQFPGLTWDFKHYQLVSPPRAGKPAQTVRTMTESPSLRVLERWFFANTINHHIFLYHIHIQYVYV